jgi:hypothetical protein
VIVLVDDSHGVGAFGRTGRGTEETPAPPLHPAGTLGKASAERRVRDTLIRFPRESRPCTSTNPITPGEASAAAALELDSGGWRCCWLRTAAALSRAVRLVRDHPESTGHAARRPGHGAHPRAGPPPAGPRGAGHGAGLSGGTAGRR